MNKSTAELLERLHQGDTRAIARSISMVENRDKGSDDLLLNLNPDKKSVVTGITGPPGSGKSTLVNSITEELLRDEASKVAILAVDPSSPFTKGSVLGDRLRMPSLFNNNRVYIRSLAARGSLGGLSGTTFEIVDVIKAAGFDHIIVETVGVGQSEVEIAALADVTIVTMVPESGDEVQTIKSGIMEIADIFVINKSDREGAALLEKSMKIMLHERPQHSNPIPVLKTIATTGNGVPELVAAIQDAADLPHPRRSELLYNRAIRLAGNHLLNQFDLSEFKNLLAQEAEKQHFNIHSLVKDFFRKNS